MTERRDTYDGAWIQGGTARIPARGEPFGGPVVVDDTPPEIKEHRKREENKDNWAFRAGNLADVYERNYTAFAEARKTMTLAEAKGFTERSLKAYDADVLAIAEGAPSDEARRRFSEDALDLRDALTTRFTGTEDTFQDMKRRSAAGIKAGALSRQAQAYPEDYAMHAAMLDRVVAGAAPLVKPEAADKFRAVEAEKMARSAVMGFIEQGRFDEGRALLETATGVNGSPGALPLSADAANELVGILEERHGQATAREARLDRVDTVLEGTAGPTDDPAEWEELVEEHYQVVAPQMAELDPAERIEVEDNYVRNLGYLPKPLTRSLRAGMLSGEADQEAAAALRLKTLADHDPALIEAIPEAERARAAAIAEFAELGLKPERAVELGEKKLAQGEAEGPPLDLRGHRFGGTEDGDGEKKDGHPDAPLIHSPEWEKRVKKLAHELRDQSPSELAEELRERGISNAEEMAKLGPEAVADLMLRLDEEADSEPEGVAGEDLVPRNLNPTDAARDDSLRQAVRDRIEELEQEKQPGGKKAGSEAKPKDLTSRITESDVRNFLKSQNAEMDELVEELTDQMYGWSKDELAEELKSRGFAESDEWAADGPETVAYLIVFHDSLVDGGQDGLTGEELLDLAKKALKKSVGLPAGDKPTVTIDGYEVPREVPNLIDRVAKATGENEAKLRKEIQKTFADNLRAMEWFQAHLSDAIADGGITEGARESLLSAADVRVAARRDWVKMISNTAKPFGKGGSPSRPAGGRKKE